MASGRSDKTDFEMLRDALLPVLEQASIGYFDRDIEVNPTWPVTVNEVLTGVQVLLEAVRERGLQNERLVAELKESRTPMSLLDELLDSSNGK